MSTTEPNSFTVPPAPPPPAPPARLGAGAAAATVRTDTAIPAAASFVLLQAVIVMRLPGCPTGRKGLRSFAISPRATLREELSTLHDQPPKGDDLDGAAAVAATASGSSDASATARAACHHHRRRDRHVRRY